MPAGESGGSLKAVGARNLRGSRGEKVAGVTVFPATTRPRAAPAPRRPLWLWVSASSDSLPPSLPLSLSQYYNTVLSFILSSFFPLKSLHFIQTIQQKCPCYQVASVSPAQPPLPARVPPPASPWLPPSPLAHQQGGSSERPPALLFPRKTLSPKGTTALTISSAAES